MAVAPKNPAPAPAPANGTTAEVNLESPAPAPETLKLKRERGPRTPAIKAPFRHVALEFLIKNDGTIDIDDFANRTGREAEAQFLGTNYVGHKIADAILQKRRIK